MLKKVIIILLLILPFVAAAQYELDINIEGVSDDKRDTIKQDLDEATVNAKLQAIKLSGLSIIPAEQMQDFEQRKRWVDGKADEVLLPGYRIINIGYGMDGKYHVELIAKLAKYKKEGFEGDMLYKEAMEIIDYDLAEAMKRIRKVIDEHPYCESGDEALYQYIIHSDFWVAKDRLTKLKSMFPDSPYIQGAEKYVNEYREKGPLSGLSFVPLVQGSFIMGSPESQENRDKDEGPQRRVNIQSFYISETEVTQRQWKEVMGDNPSKFPGDDYPVERVSWLNVEEFMKKLNQMDPGKGYRLPTEAEWEYACRGESDYIYPSGNEEIYLEKNGWYEDNSGKTTHPVGMKPANTNGLKDMLGNVAEWVEDSYHNNYIGAPTDGGPWLNNSDKKRVIRGGAYNSDESECRCTDRDWYYKNARYKNVGFRIVRLP